MGSRLGVKYCTCTWYLYLGTGYGVLVLVLVLGFWKWDVFVLVLVLEAKVLVVLASTLQVLSTWWLFADCAAWEEWVVVKFSSVTVTVSSNAIGWKGDFLRNGALLL